MPSKKHIHKYHKVLVAGTNVWACALPECNHYMPAHLGNLIPGKASLCWQCDKQMVLGPDNMGSDRPVCSDCVAESELATVIKQLEK